jgi:hypothetical protein
MNCFCERAALHPLSCCSISVVASVTKKKGGICLLCLLAAVRTQERFTHQRSWEEEEEGSRAWPLLCLVSRLSCCRSVAALPLPPPPPAAAGVLVLLLLLPSSSSCSPHNSRSSAGVLMGEKKPWRRSRVWE